MGDPEAGARFRRGRGAAEGGRHQSGRRPWRRAADRRDAEAAGGRIAASSTACASPTRRPRRSPRWSWPARSTRRSSAGSARPAAARSAFRARTAGLVTAEKVGRDASPTAAGDRAARRSRLRRRAGRGRPARSSTRCRRRASSRWSRRSAIGADGQTYNINADTMAGAIAAALGRRAAVPADRRAGRARQGQASC